jgi:diacylglycerol kinase
MMDSKKERKKFSVLPRIKNAIHAWRGIVVFLKSGPNPLALFFFAALATYMGFVLNISNTEWVLVVMVIGLVIISEAFNTAIEIDIDLTSPEYHPYARDTKDVASGAVLLSCVVAAIVGLIIFLPKILAMVQ